jgi:hypothetical protein
MAHLLHLQLTRLCAVLQIRQFCDTCVRPLAKHTCRTLWYLCRLTSAIVRGCVLVVPQLAILPAALAHPETDRSGVADLPSVGPTAILPRLS